MTETELVQRLAELSGNLAPDANAPNALPRVRRALAHALLNAQPDPVVDVSYLALPRSPVDTLSAATAAELAEIAREALAGPVDYTIRVFLRTWPTETALVPHGVPSWASGWEIQETVGPFESTYGFLVWCDIRRIAAHIRVLQEHTSAQLIALPRATFSGLPPPFPVTSLAIPAGTVWIAASPFDATAPANAFAGVRIRRGTLTLSEMGIGQSLQIRVQSGVVITLQLELDPATPLVPAGGGDAADVDVDVSEQVTFTLSVGSTGKLASASPAALEIYGNRVLLEHRPAPARYDPSTCRLSFPMSASRQTISVEESRSALFEVSGAAEITEAAWTLPVAISGNVSSLGDVWNAGGLALALTRGLHVAVPAQPPFKPVELESATLLAEHGRLSVVARSRPARRRAKLELWAGEASRRSLIDLSSSEGLTIRHDAMAARRAEGVVIHPMACVATLDRPVSAGGQRVLAGPLPAVVEWHRVSNTTRIVLVTGQPFDSGTHAVSRPRPRLSFALANAVVRTSYPLRASLAGALTAASQVDRGVVALGFAVDFLLPILPDPYASSISRDAPRQLLQPVYTEHPIGLVAFVTWTSPTAAKVRFELAGHVDATFPGLLRIADPPLDRGADIRERANRGREAPPARAVAQIHEKFRLLDVSTHADLFGVDYSQLRFPNERLAPALRIRELQFSAPPVNVSAFTLPAFQWEPVYNIPNPNALPFPATLVSPTDGGATRFVVPIATLVPVAPIPLLSTYLKTFNDRAGGTMLAHFTLPFGILAIVDVRPQREPLPVAERLRFEAVRPQFPSSTLAGGLQLMLRAARYEGQIDPSPSLPGMAYQTNNSAEGRNVLDGAPMEVDEIFNDTFAERTPLVPVQRIDFSGYGASIFSDWRHQNVTGTDVTQVKFEAIVGRTAKEVVHVRARLIPCGAIVVRVITMERTGSGGVFRRDSGWQPASDGVYDLPGCVVHPGVVPRYANIRHIRDTPIVHERVYTTGFVSDTVTLAQVLFDADIEIEGVTLGTNRSRLVPTRDIVGYVQILPTGKELTAIQIDDLLRATGPLGGPIDCELNIAQSGLHMRLSRVEVDRTLTLGGNVEFVAVARGTIELPTAGQWTFAYRGPGDTDARRLDADRPLPLIRANATGGQTAPYRIAEPGELHRPANAVSEYGLVQASGAQRLMIPQPMVRWGEPVIHGGASLLFADMYTLAGMIGSFPRADLCHPLPAGSVVRITGRRKARLEIPPQPDLAASEFRVGPLERTLSQAAALRVRSRFEPQSTITLTIDSDAQPDWSCRFGPVTVLSDVDDLEELLQVVAHVTSSADAAPELRDPQMVFGGPMKPAQAIIDFLSAFGLPFPLSVSLTNTEFGFRSGAKYVFPKYGFQALEHAIKNGLGVMAELELITSFGKATTSFEEAFKAAGDTKFAFVPTTMRGWHFALEFEAKILVRSITLAEIAKLFLGGAAKLEIGANAEGHTSIKYALGVSGAVEVDVGVATLKGMRTHSAVAKRLVGVREVGIGVSTEWQVEAEFLKGAAEVGVSFELAALVERTTDFHLKGEATLALDVTLGFLLHKTFEIEFEADERLAAAVFVAAMVLP